MATNVGRVCLPAVLAALLALRTGALAAPAETVPLEKGLVFTTTAHAGLTTGAGAVPLADTEAVYAVVATSDERIRFRVSVSAPSDAAASALLDRVPRAFDREVRREDLRSAARLTVFWNSTDPSLLPGQTFGTTSSTVLQALHAAGTIAFVLGINEPEKGVESLPALLPMLGVSRHYYRGTLERVGPSEPFSVLLDGRRSTLPAMHVRGSLTFADRTISPQLWWLDDTSNPLTLKWRIGTVCETVTRIDRAIASTTAIRTLADGLTGKDCRAELSGVYFTTASAEVLEASMATLERFAALITQHPSWQVTVEGHTDSIGSATYNMDLSTRRAAAVRDVLIRRFGVAPDRLRSQGFGLTRPVETNGTDEGRAHNRRVEVTRQCGV